MKHWKYSETLSKLEANFKEEGVADMAFQIKARFESGPACPVNFFQLA
jgi:hypothetical protein